MTDMIEATGVVNRFGKTLALYGLELSAEQGSSPSLATAAGEASMDAALCDEVGDQAGQEYGQAIMTGRAMGYARPRAGKDGTTRYTACYVDLRGRLCSAGTYSNKKEANKKWQEAEVRLTEGGQLAASSSVNCSSCVPGLWLVRRLS
jgi:hypothetical protein